MGNCNLTSSGRKQKTNDELLCHTKTFQACGCWSTGGVFEHDEFAIDQEIDMPRGRIFPDTMKYLTANESNLMYACCGRNEAAVRYYLKQGAHPNTYDENRTSPLHVACRAGSYKVIDELLQNGALVNIGDCSGWTPLHVAAYVGRAHICHLLLKKSAHAYHCNRNGQTAWDLAPNEITQQAFFIYFKNKESSHSISEEDKVLLAKMEKHEDCNFHNNGVFGKRIKISEKRNPQAPRIFIAQQSRKNNTSNYF